MDELFEFANKIFKAQAFSNLIGAELKSFKTGSAEISLTIRDALKQQHGFVHGGVISYLADNCLTYAGGSILGDSVTSEYKINYIRPAIGESLIAKATVISSGKRQAVCECKIYAITQDEKKLVATAQGTINKLDARE